MRIAIAGAGIAGLAAALALAQRGFSVEVFERAAALAEIGAGIQLSPNAMAVLGRLGIAADLAPALSVPVAVEVRNGRSGKLLKRIPLGDIARRRYGAPYCLAHRADLQAALLAAALRERRISFSLASPVDEVRSDSDGVTFRHGGEAASADLLIAADGIDSGIRRGWFAGPAAILSGTAWRAELAVAEVPSAFRLDRVGLWLGAGAHLVQYPVRTGATLNVVVAAAGSGSPGPASPPKAAFGTDLQPLFAAIPHWRTWPLARVDPDRDWVRGRVVLIGDAAHAMLPSAAQGGAQALEDAWVLAAALGAGHGSVATALATFEQIRQPRVRRIGLTARANLRLYGLRGAAAILRDAAIVALPPKLHLARLDSVYAWRPDEIAPAKGTRRTLTH